MASTAFEPSHFGEAKTTHNKEKDRVPGLDETPIAYGVNDEPQPRYSSTDDDGLNQPVFDSTHRKLKPRHIQLIGIGGTIGTALFVQIGQGLLHGGPGSLFIAFTFW